MLDTIERMSGDQLSLLALAALGGQTFGGVTIAAVGGLQPEDAIATTYDPVAGTTVLPFTMDVSAVGAGDVWTM